MKNFTSLDDVRDIEQLLNLAAGYKTDPLADHELGKGKRLGCIFLNPSLRTRLSTQVAASHLGLETVIFNAGTEGWSLEFRDKVVMNGTTVEHIRDAAPILGEYFDILALRTFPSLQNREEDYSEFYLNQFIRYSNIPVISLESATLHPLQSLADLLTIQELAPNLQKKKPKVVLTWAPHIKPLPQCVPNSLSQWMLGWGKAEFVITHPPGYELSNAFVSGAPVVHSQEEAISDADFIYVKNWSAFEDYGSMPGTHHDWMLTNEKLLGATQARIMHCLPVRRNLELAEEVLDGPQSIVTLQAANRVWAAQAVLSSILKSM